MDDLRLGQTTDHVRRPPHGTCDRAARHEAAEGASTAAAAGLRARSVNASLPGRRVAAGVTSNRRRTRIKLDGPIYDIFRSLGEPCGPDPSWAGQRGAWSIVCRP